LPADSQTPLVIHSAADVPRALRRTLRAGSLSVVYEAGEIRYIRLRGYEVVRRIYVTVRDRHWATILPLISNLEIRAQDDCFELTFEARNREENIDFSWSGRVTGDRQGVVMFSMDGRANSTFLQCRVGLCVLHPIRGLAGTVCRVEHTDGSTSEREFPLDVSPHQPFRDIRAITQKVTENLDATVRFTGAVFEMEDQRNWTDGSYKTYSPPLSVSYPSEIAAGTQVVQSVRIELGEIPSSVPLDVAASSPTLAIASKPEGKLPVIGFGVHAGRARLSGKQLARVKRLRPDHLRVDLELSQPGYSSLLKSAWEEANAVGTRLQVGLILSEDAGVQLEAMQGTLETMKPEVSSWLLFNAEGRACTPRAMHQVRERLMNYYASALIGTGSNVNFVELNRARPALEGLDFVCYPANPQIHASDNDTLIEALEAQGWTVRSAKKFTNGLPVHVTPVTFKPRHGANTIDPRQASLFGAAWTLGSLKQLAESGASSITYFETHGPRGIQVSDSTESREVLPQRYSDLVFPLYHVLADAAEYAGAEVLSTRASDPLRVEGLALHKDGTLRFLGANLTGQKESVVIQGLPIRGQAFLFELSENNVVQAMLSPEEFFARPGRKVVPADGNVKLELAPYGIVRIDAEVEL